jgi:hypothetical protein
MVPNKPLIRRRPLILRSDFDCAKVDISDGADSGASDERVGDGATAAELAAALPGAVCWTSELPPSVQPSSSSWEAMGDIGWVTNPILSRSASDLGEGAR